MAAGKQTLNYVPPPPTPRAKSFRVSPALAYSQSQTIPNKQQQGGGETHEELKRPSGPRGGGQRLRVRQGVAALDQDKERLRKGGQTTGLTPTGGGARSDGREAQRARPFPSQNGHACQRPAKEEVQPPGGGPQPVEDASLRVLEGRRDLHDALQGPGLAGTPHLPPREGSAEGRRWWWRVDACCLAP